MYTNIPAAGDGHWERFRDKFELAAVGMLGPEFLFALALGQWQSARRSVQRFKFAGYGGWTIRHAFFADMGGFVLKSPDFPTFPLDAEQLYYLVLKGHLQYPHVEKAEIDEKNKSNGLSRYFILGTNILRYLLLTIDAGLSPSFKVCGLALQVRRVSCRIWK